MSALVAGALVLAPLPGLTAAQASQDQQRADDLAAFAAGGSLPAGATSVPAAGPAAAARRWRAPPDPPGCAQWPVEAAAGGDRKYTCLKWAVRPVSAPARAAPTTRLAT
ncbi:MAG TPA: hypothetical protein VFN60_10100, partial [Acidimicrobiales bacterium]|nr:hypothetical protein [Acidimicrobiales bacterium]